MTTSKYHKQESSLVENILADINAGNIREIAQLMACTGFHAKLPITDLWTIYDFLSDRQKNHFAGTELKGSTYEEGLFKETVLNAMLERWSFWLDRMKRNEICVTPTFGGFEVEIATDKKIKFLYREISNLAHAQMNCYMYQMALRAVQNRQLEQQAVAV